MRHGRCALPPGGLAIEPQTNFRATESHRDTREQYLTPDAMTPIHLIQHINRLIHETSPYLRQHAHNPVDWYPWGEEALADRATRTSRSSSASATRPATGATSWRTSSFEDEQTAKIMNELFVNIKVDREERPDLDGIYMGAVQAMTGQGGWPMSVWLLPDGSPFYGGTYFPPFERYGMPSFRRVLVAVSDAYRTRRKDIEQSAVSHASGAAADRVRRRGRGRARRVDCRSGDAGLCAQLRHVQRRLRHRAQVSAADELELSAAIRLADGGSIRPLGQPRPASRRWRWSPSPCAKWRAGACTTSLAADSTGTRWTIAGSHLISKRCCTIMSQLARLLGRSVAGHGRCGVPPRRRGDP